MRLIDADAVKYEPLPKGERNYRTYNLDDAYDDGYDDAMFDINHMPTIDAVPVIRCKDCKHYYALNEFRGNCSEYNFVEKIPIDYCSWAERKEE